MQKKFHEFYEKNIVDFFLEISHKLQFFMFFHNWKTYINCFYYIFYESQEENEPICGGPSKDFRYRIGGGLKRRPKVKIIQMQDFWMTGIQFLKLFEKKKLFFKPGDQNRLVPGVKWASGNLWPNQFLYLIVHFPMDR